MNPITNPSLSSSQVGSAVVLESHPTAAIAAGAMNSVGDVNRLRNPLQVPMLVDEILFNVDQSGWVSGTNEITPFNGGDLRVQLKLGNDDLTQAYVPVWALDKGRNLSVAGVNGSVGGIKAASASQAGQLNSPIYGIRFSSELIMYPGEYIEPYLYNAGQLNPNVSILVRVLVKGRAMKAGSLRQSLPWISCFVGANQSVGSANFTEESTEANLANPFGTDLLVDRLVGILGSWYSTTDFGPYRNDVSVDAGLNYCLVRMTDDSGRPIVRDNTPFGHLFQMPTYAWEFKATLPPNGFYKAFLTENYASIVPQSGNPTVQAYIALVGKRMVGG